MIFIIRKRLEIVMNENLLYISLGIHCGCMIMIMVSVIHIAYG